MKRLVKPSNAIRSEKLSFVAVGGRGFKARSQDNLAMCSSITLIFAVNGDVVRFPAVRVESQAARHTTGRILIVAGESAEVGQAGAFINR